MGQNKKKSLPSLERIDVSDISELIQKYIDRQPLNWNKPLTAYMVLDDVNTWRKRKTPCPHSKEIK